MRGVERARGGGSWVVGRPGSEFQDEFGSGRLGGSNPFGSVRIHNPVYLQVDDVDAFSY